MLAYFNLKRENKRRLDEMVEGGRFENYGEAINAAIEHLHQLDKQVQRNKGLLIVGEEDGNEKSGISSSVSGEPTDETSVELDGGTEEMGDERLERPSQRRLVQADEGTRALHLDPASIPDLMERPSPEQKPSSDLAAPPTEETLKGPVAPKNWIFGQFNRFLPLKATARVLSNQLIQGQSYFHSEETSDYVSSIAASLNGYLEQIDKTFDLKRAEKVSTAFPDSEAPKSKSRRRFAEQFVVEVGKKNKEYRGMPAAYRLITTDNPDQFQLCESMWEFAILENPVLDQPVSGEGKPDRLSLEEREWILDYIRRHVPEEVYTFTVLLQAIRNGANTPGDLDRYLARNIEGADSISDSYLSSQRSGALARMTDLSLMERHREGVHVRYAVADRARTFLEEADIEGLEAG
jgi:Arc/MetJ-type ribon-helix-helix transcriptional regulator